MTDEERTRRLQGKKVILRQKQLNDAANDFNWATDHELMRLDAGEPYQMVFSVYFSVYSEGLNDPGKRQFAIETLDGVHIGNCVCYNIDKPRKEAELGILIGNRDYWGKGHGSDAVNTMVRYIVEDLGMQRIFLHTLEWNIRAQECFERCGFAPCGRIMKKGYEFIEMELMRDKFEGIEFPSPELSG